MATFTVTPANSIVANGIDAFFSDTTGTDSLIVNSDAYLIALGGAARGAFLANTLAWTVTVNGSVFSDAGMGIALAAGNSRISTIAVGADGQVGGYFGLHLQSAATVTTAGTIAGEAYGIAMEGAGARTIKNSGTVTGGLASIYDHNGLSNDAVTNTGALVGSLLLGGGTNMLANKGSVEGNVTADGGNDTVTNEGSITGFVRLNGGINKVTNKGMIEGDVSGGDGNDTVTNSGTIEDGVFTFDGNDVVTNSKSILAGVNLGEGHNILNNSGLIQGGVIGSEAGDDKITNSGSIGANVSLGKGTNTLINSGTLASSAIGGTGDDTVTNTGSIGGNVSLADGHNKLTNSGAITGNVTASSGNDTIANKGTVSGMVNLGSGNDTMTNQGTIAGIIDLSDGQDVFTGGKKTERVGDGNGADRYSLSTGDDFYFAAGHTGTDGNDIVDGSGGIDTYDAGSVNFSGVSINLDTVSHDLSSMNLGAIQFVDATTAVGADVSGPDVDDTIIGFENANGGRGNDVIYGSAAANRLSGADGIDYLLGFGGNDTLIGGVGADRLVGGTGRDILEGGIGADSFWFTSIADSGVTAATRDRIVDFSDNLDLINLSAIDANTRLLGNDAFVYLNGNSSTVPATAFTGNAGELRSIWTATGQLVEGDVNGDRKADFSFEIVDPTHAIVLTSTDFVL